MFLKSGSVSKQKSTVNYRLAGLQLQNQKLKAFCTFCILFWERNEWQLSKLSSGMSSVSRDCLRLYGNWTSSSESSGFFIILGWVHVHSPGPQGHTDLRLNIGRTILFFFLIWRSTQVNVGNYNLLICKCSSLSWLTSSTKYLRAVFPSSTEGSTLWCWEHWEVSAGNLSFPEQTYSGKRANAHTEN